MQPQVVNLKKKRRKVIVIKKKNIQIAYRKYYIYVYEKNIYACIRGARI